MAFIDNFRQSPAPYASAQVRSGASIIAIVCALASFYFSGQGRELPGILLAVVAIIAGLVGGFKALSPRVSGGILSIIAVGLGVIAVVFAIIAALV